MSTLGTLRGLALTCHPVPTAAVTVFAGLLTIGGDSLRSSVVVVVAVLTGQLVIGWHNDLVDAHRDRAANRRDKPLARGGVTAGTVRTALRCAFVVTVLMSWWSAGWLGVVLQVGLVVGSGLAYNAGLKATVWSWLPYAVAFGTLPQFVWFSVGRGAAPWWVMAVGALLGIGAHLLNVLPDLSDDRRAGIHGFPHRIGRQAARLLAPLLLLAGTVLLAVARPGAGPIWAWGTVGTAVLLAIAAVLGRGKIPFWPRWASPWSMSLL